MSRYEQRERLVAELYRLAEGAPEVDISSAVLGVAAGISPTDMPRIVEAAVARGWVDDYGEGVSLSPAGAAFAQALLADTPDRGISDIVSPLESVQLQPLLVAICESAPSGEASDGDIDDIYAQVATVRAQLRSPRPRRSIVRETLRTLKAIGEDVDADQTARVATAALRIVNGRTTQAKRLP